MSDQSLRRLPGGLLAFALAAGVCDLLTGLGLLAVPQLTLAAMGAHGELVQPVFLRFVGAFVAAVGALYLYPFALGGPRRDGRLKGVLEATALVRGAVALFVTASLVAGALEPAWIAVAATDGILSAVQLWILHRTAAGEAG